GRLPPASQQAAESEGTIVDSRRRPTGPDARERVLAEYYSDRPIDRDAVTRREDLSEVVQRAERQAERAIEQQTVSPQRRSYIRRVFDRVPRIVESATEGGEGSGGED